MNRLGSVTRPLMWLMAILVAAFAAGCGGGGDDGPAPATAPTASGVCSGASCVDLASAGGYVILAQAGISTVPTSAVTGDVGVSPAAATALTGFSQTLDASGAFSTSAQVVGKLFAADYTVPTPANLTTAINDTVTAYNAAAAKTPTFPVNPTVGDISGVTPIAPGVYNWTTAVAISTDVTLSGSATDVWVFQIGGNLSQANATTVTLAGGALAKNVFWQVAGNVTIGSTANFKGVVLAAQAITLGNGAAVNGRLFTGTAVTLDTNAVTQP